MDNYQAIFERYEKKYLLSPAQYEALMKRIGDLAAPDAFGETTVLNLYYDTPDYRIIRRSLEKPVYKEKLRIRSYGVPEKGSQTFLELKKKYKGIVYKRRIALPYEEAYGHLEEGIPFKTVTQIGKEIDYFLLRNRDLTRGMVIIYERTAYAGIKDPDLRITFDRNIRYRERGPLCDLSEGSEGTEILNDGECIMEVKVPRAMPLELVHLLNELKIYPHSFSKYGQSYLSRFGKSKVQRRGTKPAAAAKPAEPAKPKPAAETKPAEPAKQKPVPEAKAQPAETVKKKSVEDVNKQARENARDAAAVPGNEVENG